MKKYNRTRVLKLIFKKINNKRNIYMKIKRIKFAGISIIKYISIFLSIIGFVMAIIFTSTIGLIINSILIGFWIGELLDKRTSW